MALEIGRSISEIDNKVKELDKTLRSAGQSTKELDKALKLDPKDAEAAERKMRTLQTTVGTASQKLVLLKQKQDMAYQAFMKGEISADQYRKIETSVQRAQNEVIRLNIELKKTERLSVAQVGESFDRLTSKLNRAQSAARSLSRVAAVMLGALAAAATAFVSIGDELDDTSNKFSISAEKLQLQRNLYAKTTTDAQNYDRALSSINSVMGTIAKGRGKAYLDTLEKLGVATKDANGNTRAAADVYDDMVAALARVEDESQRAAFATVIFGDNGLNVANVAALSAEEVAHFNDELTKVGLVSSESAVQAGLIADQMDNIKQQVSSAVAELLVSLLPTLQSLIQIAQETIIPIINTIAKWFASMSPEQQKLVFFILMMVLILPKLIGVISAIVGIVKAITLACYGAAGGVGAVSAASMPLQPILLAVAAAILVVVLLLSMLAGKSADVTSELERQQRQLTSMESTYSDMAAELGTTTEIVGHNINSSYVEHNVNITAEGDTPVSQETADLVAGELADKINASLGGKI